MILEKINKDFYYKVFLFVLFLHFLLSLLNISSPLLDEHSFRQTQTAITVDWFLMDGWRLDYFTPVFGYPWSTPFEFPVYQTMVYWLVSISGLSLEVSGRLVSLAFFYLSIWPLFKIIRHFNFSSKESFIALIVYVSMPVFLFWSRTFMIESTAMFFTLLSISLLFYYERYGGKLLYLLFFLFASALAVLTKVTTFAVGLFFLFFYVLFFYSPSNYFSKRVILAVLMSLLVIAIGYAWILHSDSVKSLNIYGQYLTSESLRSWNYGTLDQRLSLGSYNRVLGHMLENYGFWILVFIFLFPYVLIKGMIYKKLFLISIFVLFISFFVFFNLYYVHNYYWYANSVWMALMIAIVLISFNAYVTERYFRYYLLVFLFFVYSMYIVSSYFQHQIDNHDDFQTVKIGHYIQDNTDSNSFIYVKGDDWSSELPFYSSRKAVMVPNWGGLDVGNESFDKMLQKTLNELPLSALLYCNVNKDDVPNFSYFGFEKYLQKDFDKCRVYIKMSQ